MVLGPVARKASDKDLVGRVVWCRLGDGDTGEVEGGVRVDRSEHDGSGEVVIAGSADLEDDFPEHETIQAEAVCGLLNATDFYKGIVLVLWFEIEIKSECRAASNDHRSVPHLNYFAR